jgi:hypothetical protein
VSDFPVRRWPSVGGDPHGEIGNREDCLVEHEKMTVLPAMPTAAASRGK